MGIDYTSIVTIFSFGCFVEITLEKTLQATGNMIYPMLFQLTGAITNIILDPIFIFGWFGLPAMGVNTRGGEMAKTRPCVVVTPSDLNMYLTTVVIVPITSTIRNYPYRVLCSVAGREGEIATDQIRTVDKSRIKRKIGELNNREIEELKEVFRQMFCE